MTCLKHLQALENHIDVLEKMLPEWGLSQFETSLSQSAHLEQLSMEMVARGCNMVAMDTVLKCGLEVQPHALRTSEIVIRALLRALDSLRWVVCGDSMQTCTGLVLERTLVLRGQLLSGCAIAQ